MRTMVDLSHWQDDQTGPPPNLQAAADNAVDAFLFKAGRGNGTVNRYDIDPSYPDYVRQAVQLGVPWGAYWWPEPNESDPTTQAALFLEHSHTPTPPLFLDVDIEGCRGVVPDPARGAAWYRTFIDELRHATNLPIVIYTADWYWDSHVAPAGIDFSDCDLRVAHYYPGRPPSRATGWTAWLAGRQPDPVAGFDTWAVWQFSAAGNGLGPALGMESADVPINVIREEAWNRWLAPELDQFDTMQLQLDELDATIRTMATNLRAAIDQPWTATITRGAT